MKRVRRRIEEDGSPPKRDQARRRSGPPSPSPNPLKKHTNTHNLHKKNNNSDDLRAFNAGLSADEGLPAIGDGQLDFSLKLFDLNQDGTLTAEELLRSLALDGAVSDDAVDADVYGVFDANRNGKVDAGEWQKALGDLGGGTGDGAKRYVFERVDRLTDSGGQLNESDFGTALMLMRTIVLGY